MDPLTHTLVGASLAATRLGRTTRLAGPALVVGANLPDVDVLSYFAGSDAALGFRRGWTHGVPALIVLPAVLAVLLWAWGRARPGPSGSPALFPRRLLGLSYLAVVSHPALDWLNTYGMRWWMPFSDTWYYGDAVFIMDPWLWLVLGGCWLATRRPTPGLGAGFAVFALLLTLVVARRADGYLPLVGTVVLLLALILLLRPPRSTGLATLVPTVGLLLGALYVAGMIFLHEVTERRVRAELETRVEGPVDDLMVGPTPADPRVWDVVVEAGGGYRHGRFEWHDGGELQLADEPLRPARGTAVWRQLAERERIPGFRRWARFPWLEPEDSASDGKIYVMDARYARRRTTGFGGAVADGKM